MTGESVKATTKSLIDAYELYKERHGDETYKHIKEIFSYVELRHRQYVVDHNAEQEDEDGELDFEQSWKPIKGRGFEKLVEHIIKDETARLGFKLVDGNKLERANVKNLSRELANVKTNVLIDYGEHGMHLPDADIIMYDPNNFEVKAIISVKVTLRERVAQTGYWRIKMQGQPNTEHIKFYFVTSDSDGTLEKRNPAKKGRAIAETDIDGSYVLGDVEESDKIKEFDKFIDDLRKLA